MTINLSGDVASIITAVGTLVVGVLQVLQARRSIVNGRKIDENTAVTKATAAKVDDVHAVQVATTGTYQTLKEPPP